MNEAIKRRRSRAEFRKTKPVLPQNSWDRQPGEGDLPWEAFVCYREFGPGRTAKKVAMKLGKAPSHMLKYSGVFNWKARVVDYESHLDQMAQQEREAAIKKMASSHTDAARYMLIKAMQVITKADPADMKVADAIAMFRAAIPVERQSRLADQAHKPSMPMPSLFADLSGLDAGDDEGPESSP